MDTELSSNSAKKLERKLKKCYHVVEKETGIVCGVAATENICICNAGLSNGLTIESIIEHFMPFGDLNRICMLPGKSCCFLSYKDLESAVTAYNKINGKLKIGQDNSPIHLAFSATLPNEDNVDFTRKPPGLKIIEDFVTEVEEQALLNESSSSECDNSMKHRKVIHYGYEFRYDINNVDKDKPLKEPIPVVCHEILSNLEQYDLNFKPDQLTINCYQPGQGIPSHVDTHSAFEDPILSLSLGSSIVMEFKHEDGSHISVLLPRRSLAIISNECRYDWTHGITPRKLDIVPTPTGLTVNKREARVSFTFRKVRQGECNCSYHKTCDSYQRTNIKEIDTDLAVKLEEAHVHEVYEHIADHFSETRHKPWPNVLEFVQSLPAGSVLVDVGCGNGKYLGHNNNIYDLGCDRSFGLIDVCQKRGFEVFNCNCLQIPLRNEIADGIISIAVIHHLANADRRRQAIKEMIRVLRINGQALIYVWAKDQNVKSKSSYLMQDRKNRKQNSEIVHAEVKSVSVGQDVNLPVHTNRKQFQHHDLLVPWKLRTGKKESNEFLRYYHVFDENELELLCASFVEIEVVKSYYDQGNWCVIVKRIK